MKRSTANAASRPVYRALLVCLLQTLFVGSPSAWAADLIGWDELKADPAIEFHIVADHPRILTCAAEFDQLKRRLQLEPTKTLYWDTHSLARVMAEDDRAGMKAMAAAEWRSRLDFMIKIVSKDRCLEYNAMVGRQMQDFLEWYDCVARAGAFTPEQEKETHDAVFDRVGWLLTAYPCRDRIPGSWRVLDWVRSDNMHADGISAFGMTALCFPDDPRSKALLSYAIEEARWMFAEDGRAVWEGGVYQQSPRYNGASLRGLIPFFYAVRRNTNVDLFPMERLKRQLSYFVRSQPPPDRYWAPYVNKWYQPGTTAGLNEAPLGPFGKLADAYIPNVGVGDSNWYDSWYAMLAMAAPTYAKSDPDFAGQLMSTWDSAGEPYWVEAPRFLEFFIDPSIARVKPELKSEIWTNAGEGVLLDKPGEPDETWMYFKGCCQWPRAHQHHDSNSVSIYYDGYPIAVDTGSFNYSDPRHKAWATITAAHNTVAFDGVDRQFPGRIVSSHLGDQADYVMSAIEPFVPKSKLEGAGAIGRFNREVLFVKPGYFVIADDVQTALPDRWCLNIRSDREVRQEGNRLECDTSAGVAMDTCVLIPAGKFEWTVEDKPIHDMEPPPHLNQLLATTGIAPALTIEKHIEIHNPIDPSGNRRFLTVVQARKSDAAPITAQLLPGTEDVIEVRQGNQLDYVMLFPKRTSFVDPQRHIDFQGRVGVVRMSPIHATTLVDGGAD
jgi:hypothetical protein